MQDYKAIADIIVIITILDIASPRISPAIKNPMAFPPATLQDTEKARYINATIQTNIRMATRTVITKMIRAPWRQCGNRVRRQNENYLALQ